MRVETTMKELYMYAELDDTAKERARDWYRNGGFDYEWWDFIFDDAKSIGRLMGIRVDKIYFSGFSGQGDGACFEGGYSYEKESARAVKAYAPLDKELQRIALDLSKLQRRHFYTLSANVKQRGHYNHEMCTAIYVGDENGDVQGEGEEGVKELLRDFMRWIYRTLEAEWEYMNSDEQVAETIEANEYEFTADGERA